MDNNIQEFVEELGAKSYKQGVDWNGYEVYIPQYEGNPAIGLPYVILKKRDEVRLSTPDESLAYLEYEQVKGLAQESTDSLKEKTVRTIEEQ